MNLSDLTSRPLPDLRAYDRPEHRFCAVQDTALKYSEVQLGPAVHLPVESLTMPEVQVALRILHLHEYAPGIHFATVRGLIEDTTYYLPTNNHDRMMQTVRRASVQNRTPGFLRDLLPQGGPVLDSHAALSMLHHACSMLGRDYGVTLPGYGGDLPRYVTWEKGEHERLAYPLIGPNRTYRV